MLHFCHLYLGEFLLNAQKVWMVSFLHQKILYCIANTSAATQNEGWDKSILEEADAVLPTFSFRRTHCCCNV